MSLSPFNTNALDCPKTPMVTLTALEQKVDGGSDFGDAIGDLIGDLTNELGEKIGDKIDDQIDRVPNFVKDVINKANNLIITVFIGIREDLTAPINDNNDREYR